MGFFRRAASAVDRADPVGDAVAAAMISLSPSIRRADRLSAEGTPANGVITGIRFSLNDETVRKEFVVSVRTDDGWRRIGIRTQPTLAHRLRLGMSVAVKLDGDRGVLDWPAMAAAWHLSETAVSQESLKRPPDDGVVDTALDARVQKRLRTWTPVSATIVSLSRRTLLGMATENWDIEVRLEDGTTALVKGDEVPSYAQWDAAPGAVVPARIDPKDATRAVVDWPAFAVSGFESASFDDEPPAGSIAAEIELARGRGAAPAMSAAAPTVVEADASGVVELDQTLSGWVDAVRGGYMKRKDFDSAVADWRSAGMCNAAQAAAAVAAAEA